MLSHDAIDRVHSHRPSLYVSLHNSESINQQSPSLQYTFKMMEIPLPQALCTGSLAILARTIEIVQRHNYPSSKDGKCDVNCYTHGHDSRKRDLTFRSKKLCTNQLLSHESTPQLPRVYNLYLIDLFTTVEFENVLPISPLLIFENTTFASGKSWIN